MAGKYGSMQDPNQSSTSSFSPTEFLIIKESIYNNVIYIKKQVTKLDKILKLIGSKNDNVELRNKIQTIQKNNGQIIKNTTADIKKLSSIVKFSHSSNDKTHQLMLEKIISEFHSIAEKYLQSEKNLTLRMKKTLLVNLDESSDEDVNSSQQKHLLQANATAEIQNSLFLDREQQFQNIEKDVNDINQIMNEISTLIQDQGEGIQSIDNAITQVNEDVEGGVSELQKASEYQQKFRRKVLIALIIVLILAFIVVFSLYSELKK